MHSPSCAGLGEDQGFVPLSPTIVRHTQEKNEEEVGSEEQVQGEEEREGET